MFTLVRITHFELLNDTTIIHIQNENMLTMSQVSFAIVGLVFFIMPKETTVSREKRIE